MEGLVFEDDGVDEDECEDEEDLVDEKAGVDDGDLWIGVETKIHRIILLDSLNLPGLCQSWSFYLLNKILKMKKVIAALWAEPNAPIAENAARAPYFLVFEDDKFIEAIKNPFVVGGGAWYAVAQMLKDIGADVFVAKKVWPNLKQMLDEYGIKIELSEEK